LTSLYYSLSSKQREDMYGKTGKKESTGAKMQQRIESKGGK
jgi:hypothetical protein